MRIGKKCCNKKNINSVVYEKQCNHIILCSSSEIENASDASVEGSGTSKLTHIL